MSTDYERVVKTTVPIAMSYAETIEAHGFWPYEVDIQKNVFFNFFRFVSLIAAADGWLHEHEYTVLLDAFDVSMSYDELKELVEREANADTREALLTELPLFFCAACDHDLVHGTTLAHALVSGFELLGIIVLHADGNAHFEEERYLRMYIGSLLDHMRRIGLEPEPYQDVESAPRAESKTPREPERLNELEDVDASLAKLERLVGLAQVKKDVSTLTNLVRVRQMREQHGLPAQPLSLHMVFTGNPGTGKTTVARLLSEIYHRMGLLSRGHLVEVDRSKLVAGYIGQSAIQTREAVEEALGGILFIDEAYALTAGRHEVDFGSEVVDTLIKCMEDHRNDLIMIVAGYPDEMEEFIGSNPGMRSRFNKYLGFEDYSPDELLTIFERMCEDNGYELTAETRRRSLELFQAMHASRAHGFGNGREARNVFELALANQANRLVSLGNPGPSELVRIEALDLPQIPGPRPLDDAMNRRRPRV